MKTNNNKLALKVIFLGGVGEIGKNMTALEIGDDIMIIDCGSIFPSWEMPGVDLVIPDASYLIENREKVRGFVITHGHEDHIGGLPYILKDLNVPVYGTQLTLAILEAKLREQKVNANLNVVKPKSIVTLGRNFKVEFVNVSHSIAGSCALAISTPLGLVFHTGDFKVDYTPVKGNIIDLTRIAELGKQEVLLLLAESTNVERAGYTMSEITVGQSIDGILSDHPDNRIFVTTFASNIHRLQQLVDLARKYKRKIVFAGRSMLNLVDCAQRIGELSIEKDALVDLDEVNKYPDKELLIVTTGSQGEPLSALTRISNDEFAKIKLSFNDLIIISASPIPGNERMVYNVINNIYRHGANVIYESLAEVHVSGHACREEIKLIHALLKPKYFIPVHGEHRHQKKHAELAISMGMSPANIIITDIGDVVELSNRGFRLVEKVPSGVLLVDGLGIGDLGSLVLRDRKHLSQEGILVISISLGRDGKVKGSELTTKGFSYNAETDDVLKTIEDVVVRAVNCMDKKVLADKGAVKQNIRKEIKNIVYKKTKRNPMMIIHIMED